MGLIFNRGCSGHHFEDTDTRKIHDVEKYQRPELVYPSEERHPDHESYMEYRGTDVDFHCEPEEIMTDFYKIVFDVKQRCVHDRCGKTSNKRMFETFKSEEDFKDRIVELIE